MIDLHASYKAGAEICLAAYEALAPVLRALVSTSSPLSLDLIRENDEFSAPAEEAKCCLDSLALSFLQNINNLLAVGVLARTRRAVLLNQKVKNILFIISILSYCLVLGWLGSASCHCCLPLYCDIGIKFLKYGNFCAFTVF